MSIKYLVWCPNEKCQNRCMISLFISVILLSVALIPIDILIFYVPMHYSVWGIYVPLIILFGFGLYVYTKNDSFKLKIFSIILVICIIFLIIYGIFITITGDWYWGPTTWLGAYMLIWVAYGSWIKAKTTDNNDEVTNMENQMDQTPQV